MATLLDILRFEYPGTIWTMNGEDDYAGLVWHEGNTIPKPTEAEIRAKSDSAHTKRLRFEARRSEERQFVRGREDPMIRLAEIVTRTCHEIIVALPADVRGKIDRAPLDGLIARLRAIRSDPGD